MATATLEQDTIVSQPSKEIIFAARRDGLRLVMIPEYKVLDELGRPTSISRKYATFKFLNGLFRIPTEGKVQTEHGVEWDVSEVLPWLESHRLNGDRFEGFWKVEMAAPPVSGDEMKALMDLGMSFDRDGLKELVAQETAGWNREELLDAARNALASIARLEAQAKAEAEEAAKGKGKAS